MADELDDGQAGSGDVRTVPWARSIESTEADSLGPVLRGRFRIQRRLGQGGQADVYLAHDQKLHREVAIKRSRHSWLLMHEGEIQSALEHPSIATVFDLVDYAGERFLVEEFIRGTTLRKAMRGPMRWTEFLPIAKRCLAGLVAASQRNVVHCDIKPENIVLTADGRPKILDFGFARKVDLEQVTVPLGTEPRDEPPSGGTPGYMAPEAIENRTLDPRADVFSLGVVFYEMLTGKNPFWKSTRQTTEASTLRDSPAAPRALARRVPRMLSHLVMRMLERDPVQRPSAAEVLQEIDRWEEQRKHWIDRLAVGVPLVGIISAMAVLLYFVIPRSPVAAPPEYLTLGEFQGDGTPRLEALALGFREAVKERLAVIPGLEIVEADAGFVTDLAVTAEVAGTALGESYDERGRLIIEYTVREGTERRLYWDERIQERVSGIFRAVEVAARGISYALEKKYGLEPLPLGGTPPAVPAPVFARYLEGRGRLELRGEALASAASLFQDVVAAAPEFPMARVSLAEALWALHGPGADPTALRRTEEVALSAVGAAADLPVAHVTLGQVLLETGREEESLERFRRAVELDPLGPSYRSLASALESLGRTEEAREVLEGAVAARPGHWMRHDRLGVHLYRHHEYEQAAASFREAARLAPESAMAFAKLGAMYAMLGRNDDAEAAYRKSIAVRPNYMAYTNWGTLLRNDERAEEAAALYEEAVREVPDDYRLWAALTSAYDLLPGRKEATSRAARRAIELAEAVSRARPGDANLLVFLAQLHGTIGQMEEAATVVERALETAPEEAGVLLNAALVFEGLGERTRALEMVRRALRAGFPPPRIEEEPGLKDLVADPAYGAIVREIKEVG